MRAEPHIQKGIRCGSIADISIFSQYFFSQINDVQGMLPDKGFFLKSFCKFNGQNLAKYDFFGRSIVQIFFQEICSSGGKQTIHKISAAFFVKSCQPYNFGP